MPSSHMVGPIQRSSLDRDSVQSQFRLIYAKHRAQNAEATDSFQFPTKLRGKNKQKQQP